MKSMEELKKSVVAKALGVSVNDLDDEQVMRYDSCNYLSEHETRSGHSVLWYLDEAGCEACYDMDDERYLDDAEIGKELF